jgi:hypothetical protein
MRPDDHDDHDDHDDLEEDDHDEEDDDDGDDDRVPLKRKDTRRKRKKDYRRTVRGAKKEAQRRKSKHFRGVKKVYDKLRHEKSHNAKPVFDRAANMKRVRQSGRAKSRKDLTDMQIARIIAQPAGGKPRASIKDTLEELRVDGLKIGYNAVARLRAGASYLFRTSLVEQFRGLQKTVRGRPKIRTAEGDQALIDANEVLVVRNGPSKRIPKGKRPGSRKQKTKGTPMYEIRGLAASKYSDSTARKALAEKGIKKRPNRTRTLMDQGDMGKALKWAKEILKSCWREFFVEMCVFLDLKQFATRTSMRAQFLRSQSQWTYRNTHQGKEYARTKLSKFKSTPGKHEKIFAAAGAGTVLQWEIVEGEWNEKVYVKMIEGLRRSAEKLLGWSAKRTMYLMHDNEKCMQTDFAARMRRQFNIVFLAQPANCPRVQPWDYHHWNFVESRMLQGETEAGGYIDYKALMRAPSQAEGFHARLRQIALAMPSEVVDKAHANLWDRAKALVDTEGGFFEDGVWRTPGQRRMQRVNRELQKLRCEQQFSSAVWAQGFRQKRGITEPSQANKEAQLEKLRGALLCAQQEAEGDQDAASRASRGGDSEDDSLLSPEPSGGGASPPRGARARSRSPRQSSWECDFFAGTGTPPPSPSPPPPPPPQEEEGTGRGLFGGLKNFFGFGPSAVFDLDAPRVPPAADAPLPGQCAPCPQGGNTCFMAASCNALAPFLEFWPALDDAFGGWARLQAQRSRLFREAGRRFGPYRGNSQDCACLFLLHLLQALVERGFFGGADRAFSEVRTVRTCLTCGEAREESEAAPHVALKWEADAPTSVQALVESSWQQEAWAVRCRCRSAQCLGLNPEGTQRDMSVERSLMTKGRVLVVQLGRFDNGGRNKKKTKVFVDEAITVGGIAFRLSSVIHHIGSTIRSGHYTVHSLQADGAWAVCDDSSVGPSSLAAARETTTESQPYVLVYR